MSSPRRSRIVSGKLYIAGSAVVPGLTLPPAFPGGDVLTAVVPVSTDLPGITPALLRRVSVGVIDADDPAGVVIVRAKVAADATFRLRVPRSAKAAQSRWEVKAWLDDVAYRLIDTVEVDVTNDDPPPLALVIQHPSYVDEISPLTYYFRRIDGTVKTPAGRPVIAAAGETLRVIPAVQVLGQAEPLRLDSFASDPFIGGEVDADGNYGLVLLWRFTPPGETEVEVEDVTLLLVRQWADGEGDHEEVLATAAVVSNEVAAWMPFRLHGPDVLYRPRFADVDALVRAVFADLESHAGSFKASDLRKLARATGVNQYDIAVFLLAVRRKVQFDRPHLTVQVLYGLMGAQRSFAVVRLLRLGRRAVLDRLRQARSYGLIDPALATEESADAIYADLVHAKVIWFHAALKATLTVAVGSWSGDPAEINALVQWALERWTTGRSGLRNLRAGLEGNRSNNPIRTFYRHFRLQPAPGHILHPHPGAPRALPKPMSARY